MKKSTVITALVAILTMAVTPAFAQEEDNGEHQLSGFKKFNVREDFTENGFQWFLDEPSGKAERHNAELLAAGDKEKSNDMTLGWGGIGTLWGRTALTVYVAEKRYTKELMGGEFWGLSASFLLHKLGELVVLARPLVAFFASKAN